MKKSDILIGLMVLNIVMLLFITSSIRSINTGIANQDSAIYQKDNSQAGVAVREVQAKGGAVPQNNPESELPIGQRVPLIDMADAVDDDPFIGDEDAPVTIVEFSDFECPFCARFYQQTFSLLKTEYIDTGKVKLVFRDFPLSFHPNAQNAAEVAECANEQGKFWEMHDVLFDKHSEWSEIGLSKLKEYAKDIDLDTEQFDSCLDTNKYADEVQDDFRDGQQYGVSGTPSFLINGKLLVGAQPYSVFKQIIDTELTV